MTDMHKTTALRVFLFCIIFAAALIAAAIVDALYERLAKFLGWPDQPAAVEGIVFCVVLLNKIWGWLTNRVWIGRQS